MPALDIKHDVARRHARPPTAAQRPPATDVRPAMRTEVLPPSTAAPAAARAVEMVAAPAAKPDVAARAQMSVALQQNVGNARMGAMVSSSAAAPAAHPQLPKQKAKEAPHPAPHEAPKDGEKAPVKAVAPVHAKSGHAKGAEAAHPKGGEKKKAPAKGGPSAKQAIAPAIHAVHQRAGQARKHTPAGSVVGNAQAAAIAPKTEQTRGAAVQTVAGIDSAKAEKVKRDSFRSKLREAIDKATPKPKTESEADHVMKAGAAEASTTLHGSMSTERDAAAGPLKGAAKEDVPPSAQPEPLKTELKPETVGAPPAPVSAGPVVPAPLPPERLDYSSDRASTDNAMEENHINKDQLAKGNEPAFKTTLDARSTAEKHEATAEGKYRKEEANVQGQAHTAAAGALAGGLGAIHGLRGLHVGNVAGHQTATQKKNAQERQRITDTITGYKNAAKLEVEQILTKMEEDAGHVFDTALARAEKAYEDTFEDAKGGVGTWLTTWGDDWKQLIEDSLSTARQEYLRQVGIGIDEVADLVDTALAAAKKRVADGRKQVEDFVAGLDKSVRGFGDEAMQSVSADFDSMSSDIDQRGDQLVEKLTAQYKASYERMSAKEEALREANKSLWERVYDATVGLIKKIIAFKDMLVNVLRKAANVIMDIISDPIGFLGNLVEGVMTGLRNFMKNIGAHLKRGLMEWLFGALAGAGLKMPEEFDLKGIVSIVLQVLGLTYANFRARAVAIVGEGVVSGLEKAAEIFKIIATEGVAGLWKFIKEKVEDLKSMVLDAIFDFVKERVLIAGVTWIIGLLNPASAFFKACKAIYDIVKFFIERAEQIMALINAIIDSIAAIAKGQLATAAKWVEEALAKTIPIAIGFLASLLGLGDISGTVKKVIDKAQAPVNKAIDWAIHQAVKFTKVIAKAVGGLFGKKDKEKDKPADAKGEAGHIAIAQEAGEKLVGLSLPPEPEEAKAVVKRTGEKLSTEYAHRLEPGVKLTVHLLEPPADKKEEEVDFDVTIAPNVTKLKFSRHTAGFLPAEAGTYAALSGKASVKNEDGSGREAHHAPPVALAHSIGDALIEAGSEMMKKRSDHYDPEKGTILIDAGNDLQTSAEGHGGALSAILVHENTHKHRSSEKAPRIHGSEMRKHLARYLRGQKGDDVATTTKDLVVVNPGKAAFGRQIEKVAEKVSGEDNLTAALRSDGPAIVTRVYEAEESRAMGAVEQAVSKSKVDGSEKKRRSAIAALKKAAKETWRAMIGKVKF